jgi:hypothetical protein
MDIRKYASKGTVIGLVQSNSVGRINALLHTNFDPAQIIKIRDYLNGETPFREEIIKECLDIISAFEVEKERIKDMVWI